MRYTEKRWDKFWPNKEMKKISLAGPDIYKRGENPEKFWSEEAENLFWFKKWEKTYEQKGDNFKWFLGGKINLCYNAVDRHLNNKNPAVIWIPEPLKEKKLEISYKELYEMVNSAASLLQKNKIKKGDVVGIYLPLIPEAIAFCGFFCFFRRCFKDKIKRRESKTACYL